MNIYTTACRVIPVLCLAPALHAQTWDGGGADNNLNTAANWNPNAVPASNGTANLVFAGTVRTTPVVNVNFDVAGLTFNSTAGAFNISPGSGTALTVRSGGITNNDAESQVLSTPVNFATGSSITAASGNISLTGAVGLGTNTVTVGGGFNTSVQNVTGTGMIVKNGAGTYSVTSASTSNHGLTLNAGTVDFLVSGTYSGAPAAISAVGGTLDFGSNFTLNTGASLAVGAGATLVQTADRSFNVQSDSDVNIAGSFTSGNSIDYTVTGGGSTFTSAGLTIRDGSTMRVLEGATLDSNTPGLTSCTIGASGTSGSILVDGTNSDFSAVGSSFQIASSADATGSLTCDHAATGTIASTSVSVATGTNSTGSLTVKGGARLSTGTVDVAHFSTSGTGTVLVSGPGSRLTATFNVADFSIGGTGPGTATVTVADGGELDLAGPLTIGANGRLILDGGIITMDPGQEITNNGLFDFRSGRITLGDNLVLGGVPFGANLTLGTGMEVSMPTSRTTTLALGTALVLDGGSLSTGALTLSGGTFDFRRGTLRLTGSSVLTVSSNGPLGGNLLLAPGMTLGISGNTAIASGSVVEVAGGTFSTSLLTNGGSLLLGAGTASIASGTNTAEGLITVGRELVVASGLTNNAGGRIDLTGGTGRITGNGTLTNSGVLSGDGRVAVSVTNSATGKIRVDASETLSFTGSFAANAGELQLQGGSLDFTNPVTNSATGSVSGHGELFFPDTPEPTSSAPAAGFNNSGRVNLSGGDSLIFGTVANESGGRIIVSGGAMAVFFDVFRHSGAEVKASADSALVFFSEVRGPGSFTGSGTIYMESGFSPGASPASVSIAPQMVFTDTNTLTMELGGTAAGTQHDKLLFTSASSEQVTWSGTLNVELLPGFTPAAGQSFDLFDFDAARDAGTFSEINLPALPAGLAWDTSQLYTTGAIRVGTGTTFAQWAATALGDPAATAGGDHDSDGIPNAIEFALGLFPAQPGSSAPVIDLHPYTEGDRLRARFTRPLDRAGVTLTIQTTSDLIAWTDVAESKDSAPFAGAGFVSENRSHPVNEPGQVEVRDIFSAAGHPRRAMRLRVEITP